MTAARQDRPAGPNSGSGDARRVPGPWTPETVARTARLACVLEAAAPKVGNVTPTASFPDLTFHDLAWAANAIGPILGQAGQHGVGETVLRAVRVTRSSGKADPGFHGSRVPVGNPNLGIALLLAPICRAALRSAPTSDPDVLRAAVGDVLRRLDVEDATHAFAAITLASPGGLGDAAEHDVREPATVDLRAAMTAAADRDGVAGEYATTYAATFGVGLPAFRSALASGRPLLDGVVATQLALMADRPDTLIARKVGAAVAAEARDRARVVVEAGGPATATGRAALADLDAWLRADGHRRNPGTTADVVAAVLLVALLLGDEAAAGATLGAPEDVAAVVAGALRPSEQAGSAYAPGALDLDPDPRPAPRP